MKEEGGQKGKVFFFQGGVNRNKKQPGNSTYPVKYDRVIHQPPPHTQKKKTYFILAPKK
jgi:hypothetical protein